MTEQSKDKAKTTTQNISSKPDDLIKPKTKSGNAELTEQELGNVAGAAGGWNRVKN